MAVSALLTTAGICTGRDPKEIADEIGMGGGGALKAYVIDAVNSYFEPIRQRRAEFAAQPDLIRDIITMETLVQTLLLTPPLTRCAKQWEWSIKCLSSPYMLNV